MGYTETSGNSSQGFSGVGRPTGKLPARMLVTVAHGVGFVLMYSAPNHIEDFIIECGGKRGNSESNEGFALAQVFGDPPAHVMATGGPWFADIGIDSGPWFADIGIDSAGPGDYPGIQEYELVTCNWKPVSEAEWKEFCEGNWCWNVADESRVSVEAASVSPSTQCEHGFEGGYDCPMCDRS